MKTREIMTPVLQLIEKLKTASPAEEGRIIKGLYNASLKADVEIEALDGEIEEMIARNYSMQKSNT